MSSEVTRTGRKHVCSDGKARTVYTKNGTSYVQRRSNGSVRYVKVLPRTTKSKSKGKRGGAPDAAVCCALNKNWSLRETMQAQFCPPGMLVRPSPC